MDAKTEEAFKEILKIPGNDKCLDCGVANPYWASVNNGAFLCMKCCGIHRNMGVHISFMRSTTMDKWSSIQIERMRNGGNAKLKRFWEQQKFNLDLLTVKERLDNDAMDQYRTNVLKKAKGESVEKIPFIGYKKRVVHKKKVSGSQLQGFGNTGYTPQQHRSDRDRTRGLNVKSTALYGCFGMVLAYGAYSAYSKK